MAKKRAPAKSAAPAEKRTVETKRVRQPHLAVLAGLWILTLVAYANSFSSGLVYDNHSILTEDTRIQAATGQNFAEIWSKDYWNGNGPMDLYRPLTTISYWFNFAILGNGANPWGYHAINLLLHGLNLTLAYLLGFWILGEIRVAAVMAGLWAVHPVLTESVTNIVGRADELAAFAVLAALVCHIQASRSIGRRRLAWIGGIAALTAMGVFSKESAIVVPSVLLLYDLAFASKAEWRMRAQSYLAAAIPCAVYLLVRTRVLSQFTAMAVPFTDNPLTGASFLTGRLTALSVIGRYFGLLFWPAALSSDYSYNQIPMFRPGDPPALLGLVVCLAAGAACFYAYWKDRRLFFFGGLFFVALAPVANVLLLIGTIMAERFLYLSALGVAACVAIGWSRLSKRVSPRAAIAIPAVVGALLMARTYVRNNDWATDLTLAQSAESVAPRSYKPHMILSTSLPGSQGVAEGERTLAILDPLPDEDNVSKPYINVGISYRLYGNQVAARSPIEAAAWYRKSLAALLRGESVAWANDRAIARECARLGCKKVGFAGGKIYLELAATYAALSQPDKQLEALRKGQPLSQFPELYFEGMAEVEKSLGDPRRAAVDFLKAILINGSQTRMSPADSAAYNRGVTAKLVRLYEKDPQSCAVVTARGVRTVNSQCPQVQSDLCSAFRELSRDYRVGNAPAGCPVN